MTVPSEINRSGPYNGNGVTVVFDYDFRILDAAHLQVIKADTNGNETTLVLTTNYTVAGVGDTGGGSITLLAAPAAGETITILRNMPFTQETDLENQGAYYAETVENALDAAVMRDQQLTEKMSRAVLVPASSEGEGGELAAQLAQGILRLAESADEIDTVAGIDNDVQTVAGIASDVMLLADVSPVLMGTASAVRMDEKLFTGDGVATEFTLDREPGVDENVLVWVGGAIQDTTDYSVDGAILTISPAVANGVEIRTLVMTLVSANAVEAIRDQAQEYADAAEDAAEEAAAIAADIGVSGKSQYDTLDEFIATNVPASVKRATVAFDLYQSNWKRLVGPVTPRADHITTADGGMWERTDTILRPEQFYKTSHGDNWQPAIQAMTSAAEFIYSAICVWRHGYTYIMDDQVLMKKAQIWFCYGSTAYMRSNPGNRGGFIRTQGTTTNISEPETDDRDEMIIYGLTARIAPGIKGVNCFGHTATERCSLIDCVAEDAVWGLQSDPVKKGGRGFSCHPRSRNVKHINCIARNCSIGFHASDKADYNSALTPVFTAGPNTDDGKFTISQANPAVVSRTNHGLVSGDRYHAQDFRGTGWSNLNGGTYVVTKLNDNQFTINANTSAYPAWNALGRLSKEDTGYMRSQDLLWQNCVAENCSISAVTLEQVIDSQNVDIARNWSFHGKAINCGWEYPLLQGVVNLSGVPGCRVDLEVYSDAAHPIGAIIRGACALSDIKVVGKVSQAANMINHTPAHRGSSLVENLDEGTPTHPEGTSRATRYEMRVEFNTVSGDLIFAESNQGGETDDQNYTWRSSYDIEYSAVSLGGLLNTRVQHKSNDFRIKNIATGDVSLVNGYKQKGTWTPVLRGSVTPGSNSYTIQSGVWTLEGDRYELEGRLTINGAVDASMSGNAEIAGLPALIVSGTQGREASFIPNYLANLALSGGATLSGRGVIGGNTITLSERNNSGDTAITSSAKFGNNLDMRFRIIFNRA